MNQVSNVFSINCLCLFPTTQSVCLMYSVLYHPIPSPFLTTLLPSKTREIAKGSTSIIFPNVRKPVTHPRLYVMYLTQKEPRKRGPVSKWPILYSKKKEMTQCCSCKAFHDVLYDTMGCAKYNEGTQNQKVFFPQSDHTSRKNLYLQNWMSTEPTKIRPNFRKQRFLLLRNLK